MQIITFCLSILIPVLAKVTKVGNTTIRGSAYQLIIIAIGFQIYHKSANLFQPYAAVLYTLFLVLIAALHSHPKCTNHYIYGAKCILS
jgi:hypothetical protein